MGHNFNDFLIIILFIYFIIYYLFYCLFYYLFIYYYMFSLFTLNINDEHFFTVGELGCGIFMYPPG